MLKSKHFKTEQELLAFCNQQMSGMQCDSVVLLSPPPNHVISIIKDVTNGEWILFYK